MRKVNEVAAKRVQDGLIPLLTFYFASGVQPSSRARGVGGVR
jgi:hypothetical protein